MELYYSRINIIVPLMSNCYMWTITAVRRFWGVRSIEVLILYNGSWEEFGRSRRIKSRRDDDVSGQPMKQNLPSRRS